MVQKMSANRPCSRAKSNVVSANFNVVGAHTHTLDMDSGETNAAKAALSRKYCHPVELKEFQMSLFHACPPESRQELVFHA